MNKTDLHIICKNCGTRFKGKYCTNCGQPARVGRLNFRSVWHDIQHGLLHIDNGIFFTIKELFTRPGHSIREYIEGKRVKHFKPVSLVIILATLYALINHFLHQSVLAETSNSMALNVPGLDFSINGAKFDLKIIREFIEDHFAVLQLLLLPFYAAASRLAFLKFGYNYTEHLVIIAYLRGQSIVLAIFFLLLVYIGLIPKHTSGSIAPLAELACLFWVFLQLFNTQRKARVVKRTFLVLFYFILVQLIIVLLLIAALQLSR